VLSPDHYYVSVADIDLDELQRRGIDTLLVDLDNTLLPRNSEEVTQFARDWANVTAEKGFKVCIVSNNWHERVAAVASTLGFALVAKALKPLPFAFWIALRRVGSTRSKSAVVGDQMFTDIAGGKLLGLTTVLVTPLSASDLPHTLVLRKLERVMLAGRQPVS
jgi:HAD superfamily phosphatase (TIGR01668 family)